MWKVWYPYYIKICMAYTPRKALNALNREFRPKRLMLSWRPSPMKAWSLKPIDYSSMVIWTFGYHKSWGKFLFCSRSRGSRCQGRLQCHIVWLILERCVYMFCSSEEVLPSFCAISTPSVMDVWQAVQTLRKFNHVFRIVHLTWNSLADSLTLGTTPVASKAAGDQARGAGARV